MLLSVLKITPYKLVTTYPTKGNEALILPFVFTDGNCFSLIIDFDAVFNEVTPEMWIKSVK